jgi:hypothetical protein
MSLRERQYKMVGKEGAHRFRSSGMAVDVPPNLSERYGRRWPVRGPHRPRSVQSIRRVSLTMSCFLAAVLGLFPEDSSGQVGTVQGRVRDGEGVPVVAATVSLQSGSTRTHAAGTDRLGSFRISDVPPGEYTLRVEALGYADYVETVRGEAAGTLEVDVRVETRALELEGISVEAERSRARIRFEEIGGATVRELNVEDLRLVPGVAEPDPVRAIEVLPGVISTSDFSAAFHVRGGSQDQNLILLDGIPIFSPFHLGGLFSVFNTDMIDHVELSSGGFAAEHGGRVSSVLAIESDAGSGDFNGEGAISLLSSRLALGGRLPDSFADALGQADVRYRVSARRSYFDVLFKPAFDFPYHLQDVQAIVEGWTRSGDRLSVTGYTGRDVFDLASVDSDFPLRVDWDWGNDAVGARWEHARRGGGSLDVRANFSRFQTGLTFPDFTDTDLSSRIQQGQLRADLDLRPSARWSVQAGTSFDRTSYANRFETGGTEFAQGGGDAWLLGSYLQTRWSVPGAWLVELGLRSDFYRPDPGDDIGEISPRIAVKRFLRGGDVALKFAAGRYTQFLHSLRDEDLPLGLDIWVLSGARAPHTVSDQLQLGLEGYQGADWFWSVEGYLRSFDGVVTFNPADDPNDDFDDILSGDGISYGADLMVRRESGAVKGWVALSYLRADRTFPEVLAVVDPKPDVTYPPVFDRRIDLDVVLSYPAPWGWTGGLRWNFGSGTPFTRALGSYEYYSPRTVGEGGLAWAGADGEDSPAGEYGVVLEDRNASRYPAYHRLDASFRKTFEKSWGGLTPYLNLVNAYNQRNVLFYFYEYEQIPAVRSGISMFPVLPTIGLEISF